MTMRFDEALSFLVEAHTDEHGFTNAADMEEFDQEKYFEAWRAVSGGVEKAEDEITALRLAAESVLYAQLGGHFRALDVKDERNKVALLALEDLRRAVHGEAARYADLVRTERFTSEGVFEIDGRGTAYAVRLPESMARDAVSERYLGKRVEIDGKVFTVKGIESWAVMTLPAGAPIVFLVERSCYQALAI